MVVNRHDKKDCGCTQYKPDYAIFDIRLDGTNFYCRQCGRLVSKLKWKGGLIHFGNRSRILKPNECPCCGYRMSDKRRGKAKLEKSIEHQINHPELHPTITKRSLPKKISILYENIIRKRVS